MPRPQEPSTIDGLMSYVWMIAAVAIVIMAGQAGGFVASALRQPRVLGELAAGLLLGNLVLAGVHGLEFLKTDPAVDAVSRVAVIVLMFQASLESTVDEMKKLGAAAFLIAACGVAGSFIATFAVSRVLLASASGFAQLFVAASLTATSVGITARVFGDLGHGRSSTAHVILAAAVVDDVLALVVLAVMSRAGSVPFVLLPRFSSAA